MFVVTYFGLNATGPSTLLCPHMHALADNMRELSDRNAFQGQAKTAYYIRKVLTYGMFKCKFLHNQVFLLPQLMHPLIKPDRTLPSLSSYFKTAEAQWLVPYDSGSVAQIWFR